MVKFGRRHVTIALRFNNDTHTLMNRVDNYFYTPKLTPSLNKVEKQDRVIKGR